MRHDREAKPGVSNLIEIYGAVTGQTIAAVEQEFGDRGYGTFKGAVAEAVVEYLRPVQERFEALDADRAEVERRLAIGADVAASIADPVLGDERSKAAGLLPRSRLRAVYFFGTFHGAGRKRFAGHAACRQRCRGRCRRAAGGSPYPPEVRLWRTIAWVPQYS